MPVGESRAWQWVMTLDDTPVRIDVLTGVLDHPGGSSPCRAVRA